MRIFLTIWVVFLQSCSLNTSDTFNQDVLTSSKQEKIYINTLNWGVTNDYQISAVSVNEDKVRERSDTVNVIKGLEPFIYKFKEDTLNLYFNGEVNYNIKQKFKTIHVNYIPLDRKKYRLIQALAYDNEDGYHSVPKRKGPNYPSNRPKPLSN